MEEDAGCKIKDLKVDGGASRNGLLMQFQSDIIGANVIRPIISETTALGAAFLAGLAVGFWKNKEEIESSFYISEEYEPRIEAEERDKLYKGWKRAVERVKGWEE